MNEAQRLRCLELAASLGVAPNQVMRYARIFASFVRIESPVSASNPSLSQL